MNSVCMRSVAVIGGCLMVVSPANAGTEQDEAGGEGARDAVASASSAAFEASAPASDSRRAAEPVQLAAAAHLSFAFTLPESPEEAAPPVESAPGGINDLAQKLQNPVADLISVPLQFNYDAGLGPNDTDRLILNIQPVIPITLNDDWSLISRTILPVIYREATAPGLDSDFGLGDVVQSFFFSPKKPVGGWILGVGPVALLPTATDSALGSDTFGLGPTAVALQQRGGWSFGALANHIWGLSEGERGEVNLTFVQPFVSYTWPSATTLGLTAEMTYDWSDDELTVPLNLTVSQLVSVGDQPVQFVIGGRYYADGPAGGPEWGLRFGLTFLFPK